MDDDEYTERHTEADQDKSVFRLGMLRIWNDDRVENWYRQNLLLAAADPGKLPSVVFDTPISVVHPVLWNSRLDG